MQKFVKEPMKKVILKVCSFSAFLLVALFVQGQVLAASWTNIDGGASGAIYGDSAVGVTNQSTSSNNVTIGPSGSYSGNIYGGYPIQWQMPTLLIITFPYLAAHSLARSMGLTQVP